MNKRYSGKAQKQEAGEVFLLTSTTGLPAKLGFRFEDGHGGLKESSQDF